MVISVLTFIAIRSNLYFFVTCVLVVSLSEFFLLPLPEIKTTVMSKGKLQKFADMERYENVFQYPYSVIDNVPFDM